MSKIKTEDYWKDKENGTCCRCHEPIPEGDAIYVDGRQYCFDCGVEEEERENEFNDYWTERHEDGDYEHNPLYPETEIHESLIIKESNDEYEASKYKGKEWGIFAKKSRSWVCFGTEKEMKERAKRLNSNKEESLISEAEGLNLKDVRVENDVLKLNLNGKEYGYKSNDLNAEELLAKYNSIKKHSEGKAYAWLKKNSILVSGGKQVTESKQLQERAWKFTLDSSVRKAIMNDDAKGIVNCLRKYNETIQNSNLDETTKEAFQEYIDEQELDMDDILNDELDEEYVTDTIDYILEGFYDICDAEEVFVSISESKELKEYIENGYSGEVLYKTKFSNLQELKQYIEDQGYELMNDDMLDSYEALNFEIFDPAGFDGEVYHYDITVSNPNLVQIEYNARKSYNLNESLTLKEETNKKTLKENNEGPNVELYHFNNRLNEVRDMIEKAYDIGSQELIENYLTQIKTMVEKYSK